MEANKIWVRQPQECAGDYFFNGRLYISQRVIDELSSEEINWIIGDLRAFIAEQAPNGADYLQIYKRSDGRRKIYIIDQLSLSNIRSGLYTKEEVSDYHYYTILFSDDY